MPEIIYAYTQMVSFVEYAGKGLAKTSQGLNTIGRVKSRIQFYGLVAASVIVGVIGIMWFVSNQRLSEDDKQKLEGNLKWGPLVMVIASVVSALLAWYKSYVSTSSSAYASVSRKVQGADTVFDTAGYLFKGVKSLF